jgi:hypothetical protein
MPMMQAHFESTLAQYYKNDVHNSQMIVISLSVFPGKSFQPSLMFASNGRAYQSIPPPGLLRKHDTRLERPARDKHSSLLPTFVNCVCKKFYNTDQKILRPIQSRQGLFTRPISGHVLALS